MSGALIIKDNVFTNENVDSITPIGTGWTGIDNLYNHRLSPYASYPVQTGEVGLQIDFTESSDFGYVCLLGCDVPNSLTILIKSGFDFEPVEYDVFAIESENSKSHVIRFKKESLLYSGVIVKWFADNEAGKIGSIFCGSGIESPHIADNGWSIPLDDRAIKKKSEGGQVYVGTKNVVRQLRFSQSGIDQALMFGIPSHGETMNLGVGTLFGSMTYNSSGNFYEVGDGLTGFVTFGGGPFDEENFIYRVDYSTWHEYTEAQDVEPSRWEYDHGTTPFAESIPLSKTSIVRRNSTMAFVAKIGTGKARLRINKVSKIPNNSNDLFLNNDISKLSQNSLLRVLERHGQTKPIIVMLNPNDAAMVQTTGIYGMIVQSPTITKQAGEYAQSALVIEEVI